MAVQRDLPQPPYDGYYWHGSYQPSAGDEGSKSGKLTTEGSTAAESYDSVCIVSCLAERPTSHSECTAPGSIHVQYVSSPPLLPDALPLGPVQNPVVGLFFHAVGPRAFSALSVCLSFFRQATQTPVRVSLFISATQMQPTSDMAGGHARDSPADRSRRPLSMRSHCSVWPMLSFLLTMTS